LSYRLINRIPFFEKIVAKLIERGVRLPLRNLGLLTRYLAA
jgi:hypothetical protein